MYKDKGVNKNVKNIFLSMCDVKVFLVPAPLVTNPVISHEVGKDLEVYLTSGTYPWSFDDL
jgi:hypothetical protein